MFGKKKPKPEEPQHPAPPAPAPPPPVRQVPAPPPVSSWTPPDLSGPGAAAPAGPPAVAPERPAQAPKPAQENALQVTPDYTGAPVIAANHILVQGGEGRIILDVGTELRDQPGGKLLPVAARIVMTAQTGRRLVEALELALAKLKG